MNRTKHLALALTLSLALIASPMLAPIAQAAPPPAQPFQTESPSEVLTPEALANMEYQSLLAAEGVALLEDGVYTETIAPGSASVTTVSLLTEPMAFGVINEQDAAAVLLAENGGGSGTFVSLAVVVDQDGTPINVATTLLGDRVQVNSMIIENDQIIVAMTTHGPDDPMCCPTQPVIDVYSLVGNALSLESQIFVTLDPGDLADSYMVGVMPATPYDESLPPGPTGMPSHIVIGFDGDNPTLPGYQGPLFAIIPADDYATLWSDAGNDAIAQTLESLSALLSEQPENPEPPLPILPPPGGVNDLAVQVSYPSSPIGTGMSFVGRTSQDASPVLRWQTNYYFNGLSEDNSLLVVAQTPIVTEALPEEASEMTPEMQALAEDDFPAYLAATSEMLNELAPADFTPNLASLNAMMESLNMEFVNNPLSYSSLSNMAYQSQFANSGEAFLVNGVYTETIAPGSASQISVALIPEPIAYGSFYGLDAAAVLLAESGGGSGTFVNLALVIDVNGSPVNIATTLLGDRVQVNAMAFDNNAIVVDLLTAGPNDPLCCPSQQETRVYSVGLIQQESSEGSAPTEDAGADAAPVRETPELAGTTWQWVETQMSDDSLITPDDSTLFQLTFEDDGGFATTTDCNAFRGTYSADSTTGQLNMEANISTRMACPPESQQDVYINGLNGAASYLTQDGDLFIALQFDSGIMQFSPVSE
jgi:heat shock protein HslJ